ncbi:tautomerase family protein [Agromyces sp. SYSU T00194]|uniref:tautomerase family protein n=1 Tax=Agromyces chitinivorans TaxID=3158560 RepID=UPI00339AEC4C
MPLIQISIGEGRTDEQVRTLVTELTDATVRAIGARREAVSVIVTPVPATHWANGGTTIADKRAAREAAASS